MHHLCVFLSASLGERQSVFMNFLPLSQSTIAKMALNIDVWDLLIVSLSIYIISQYINEITSYWKKYHAWVSDVL